jgi:hypothetical protein
MPNVLSAFASAGGFMLSLFAVAAEAQEARPAPPPPPPQIHVDTRMMSSSEVDAGYNVNGAYFQTAAGIFVAPAGLFSGVTMPSNMSGGGVQGNPNVQGITAGLIGPPVSFAFQSRQEGVSQVLKSTNFPDILAQSLRQRIQSAKLSSPPPQAISVAIAYYGLQAQAGRPFMLDVDQQFCVVTSGAASLAQDGNVGTPQSFSLGVNNQSSGMADPLCDTFSTLAASGGLRLRQLLYQSAGNVADWLVVNQLGGQ